MDKEFVKCDSCSKCCEYMLFPLFNRDHAIWALHHGVRVFCQEDSGELRARVDIKCERLKDVKCSIYDSRPEMCKEYNCETYPKLKELFL